MDFGSIVFIAIALSMDAFAVAMTNGIMIKKLTLKHILIFGFAFGFFQFIMPVIGYLGATNFSAYITSFDHWIAFLLLALIGGKMLYETFQADDPSETTDVANIFTFKNIVLLAVATSIDAMAVGISLAFLNAQIISAALVIGITAFLISSCGVVIGNKLGSVFKKSAERIGGIILIGIGIKILVEHIFL